MLHQSLMSSHYTQHNMHCILPDEDYQQQLLVLGLDHLCGQGLTGDASAFPTLASMSNLPVPFPNDRSLFRLACLGLAFLFQSKVHLIDGLAISAFDLQVALRTEHSPSSSASKSSLFSWIQPYVFCLSKKLTRYTLVPLAAALAFTSSRNTASGISSSLGSTVSAGK